MSVNINILGISELKWTGKGEFNSDDHYIYYCGQESLRRNGVAIIVNRVSNAVLGWNLRNNRMISIRFQGKPLNITVIQVYAPTNNAKEAEVEWFYEDLQDLELTPQRDVSTYGHHQMVNTEIRLIIFFAAKDGEAQNSQQKQDRELTVAQIVTPYCQIQTEFEEGRENH